MVLTVSSSSAACMRWPGESTDVLLTACQKHEVEISPLVHWSGEKHLADIMLGRDSFLGHGKRLRRLDVLLLRLSGTIDIVCVNSLWGGLGLLAEAQAAERPWEPHAEPPCKPTGVKLCSIGILLDTHARLRGRASAMGMSPTVLAATLSQHRWLYCMPKRI